MTITREDDFGGAVLNCAVRYALGRRSYMPGLVVDEITPMLKDCSDKTLWCFDKDVREWLNLGGHGIHDSLDKWTSFLMNVNKEQDRREKEEHQ